MTTGSYNRDGRFLKTGGVFGSYQIGTLYTGSWSGTNYSKRTPRPPKPPPFAYTDFVRVKGQMVPVVKYHSGFTPDQKPKRMFREEHPFSKTLTELVIPAVTVKNLIGTTGVCSPYYDLGIFNNGQLWSANDDIELVKKLKEEIESNDFDMSVFLGTSFEALRMIAQNATKIYKALRALKKGNVSLAAIELMGKRSRKHRNRRSGLLKPDDAWVAERWLELQYGWKPLLKDTYALAQFMAHQLNFPTTQSYRVSRKVKGVESYTPSQAIYDAHSRNCYTRKGIVARIIEQPSLLVKMGLADPENLAWELLGWSFVIDWFIPIGDWLEARSFASHLSGTFITSSKTYSFSRGIKLIRSPVSYWEPISDYNNSTFTVFSLTFNRTVSTTLNVPMPEFKPLGKAASVMHVANAIALLTSLRRK